MLQLLLKNNFTIWVKWILNTSRIKKRFPTASIGFMAKVYGDCRFGYQSELSNHAIIKNVSIGDFSYVGTESRFNYTTIGKFCSIGPGVYAGLGTHPIDSFISSSSYFYTKEKDSTVRPYFEEYKQTTIGNDVWIGSRAILIDGVTIGDGAIIGAGAIVTKDVPPYAIVGGIPAKIIRYRFEPEVIDLLLQYRWWEKDKNWIEKNIMLFSDVTKFLSMVKAEVEEKQDVSTMASNSR